MDAERFGAQAILFARRPTRLALHKINLEASSLVTVTINVWRNHTIEPVIALGRPYIAYGRWQANFRLSDYDDTLAFVGHSLTDVELLWVDSSRYLANTPFERWLDWLGGRIRALRTISTAPIIVATWLDEAVQRTQLHALVDGFPAVYFADLGAVCSDAGVPLTDARSATMAGTSVSNVAQPLVARKLACHWLPAVSFPPVKALALDLDHTLHAGVLGEDGIDGVQLTPGHQALQSFIKSLQQRGIFIALVTRNERPDVEALFTCREDYPLRWNDFSATEISWGDKASALVRVANALHIAPDALLFVDDNLGELVSVALKLPQVHALYADQDAGLTQRAIEYYPGLWRWKVEADDAKRVGDLKANAEREVLLAETTDLAKYFASLQVLLIYRYDPTDQLSRLVDLCNKTNQFNLAIRRFNQAEVAERLKRVDACVASVQVKDRLSDSGVVAVIVAERHGEQLRIEELCVSCRAMGRQLEDTLILPAIREMTPFSGCREVAFRVQRGPRNQPALDWLAKLLGGDDYPAPGLYPISAERLLDFVPADGVTVIKE